MAVPYELIVEEDLNIGTGTVQVSMPAGGSATGRQINKNTFETFNVRRYGAVGDGSTNDTLAFTNTIAAIKAAGGGCLYIPNGDYRLTAEIDCLDIHNLEIKGESRGGARLIWDDTANLGLKVDTTADPVLSVLTADVAVGDRVVAVTSGAGFTVGEWGYLQDSQGNHPSLMTKIAAISGNNVTLQDAFPGVIDTAHAATLYSYVAHPLLRDFKIRDLTLMCTSATPTHFLSPLFISRAYGFRAQNLHIQNTTGPLITLRACRDGSIQSCLLENALTVAGSGVEVQTSTGTVIANNQVRMSPFGFTTANSPYTRLEGNHVGGRATSVALGRGIRVGNGSNFSCIVGNAVHDCNLFGIYSQDSAYCSIVGNTIAFNGVDTQEHGIAIGGFETDFCKHCTISGNTILGASGAGIFVSTVAGTPLACTISGNTIINAVQRGIFTNAYQVTIVGNTVMGGDTNFQFIDIATGGGYCAVVGNTTRNTGSNPTTSIQTDSSDGFNVIDGNNTDTPMALKATDIVGASKAYVDSAITTILQPRPIVHTPSSPVGTPASTVETDLWKATIPAGIFKTNENPYQGFMFHGHIVLAADDNDKTLKAYVGNASVSITLSDNNKEGDVFIYGWNKKAANVGFSFSLIVLLDGVGVKRSKWSASTNNPFTTAFDVKVTGKNGSAVANDLVLDFGALVFFGCPTAAFYDTGANP